MMTKKGMERKGKDEIDITKISNTYPQNKENLDCSYLLDYLCTGKQDF